MPRSRGRTRNKNKPPPAKPPPRIAWWRRWWRAITATVSLAILALGAASAAVAFLPRVTVDVAEGSDPWSAPFTITNTNVVPLNDVGVFLGLCVLVIADRNGPMIWRGENQCDSPNGARLNKTAWLHHTLPMDGKYTFGLDDLFLIDAKHFSGADISIVVTFKPWLLPIHRETEFRFVTRKGKNGYHWFHQTIDNP
jgi:hypothetical protein